MGIFNKKETLDVVEDFTKTKQVGGFIEFDENQKKWLIYGGPYGSKKSPKIYGYGDIIDCDLIEDGESITKGGLGRAIAGGLLFGIAGAVVGGVTGGRVTKSIVNNMKIKITVNDVSNPTVYIELLNTPTKTNSFIYKTVAASAQEILSAIAVIMNENSAGNRQPDNQTDDMRKYKDWLEEGLISQEDYDTKKRQLLGL